MSSTSYEKIVNTTVSASSLTSSLADLDLAKVLYNTYLDTEDTFATSATLNSQQMLQAVMNPAGLGVDAATAAITVSLGSDLASTANEYISLLNLSTSANPRVLSFRASGLVPAQTIPIATAGGAGTFVNVILNGTGAAAATQDLMTTGTQGGQIIRVETWATNFTSGSENVVFSVCFEE